MLDIYLIVFVPVGRGFSNIFASRPRGQTRRASEPPVKYPRSLKMILLSNSYHIQYVDAIATEFLRIHK